MDERSVNLLKHNDADALVTVTGSGEALFVINLCAANVPQSIDAGSVRAWGIAGIERYKLYQVSRMEDGRRRYRVRLGFFTSEADAELVLQSVRGKFATAFSSCLADEDVKHASGYLKKPLHEVQEIQDLQRTGRYRIPKFDEAALAAAAENSGKYAQPRMTHADASSKNSHASKAKSDSTVVEFEWSPALKGGNQQQHATVATKSRAAASAKLAAYIAANKQPVESAQPAKPSTHTPAHQQQATTKPVSVTQIPAATAGKFHVGAGREIPDHGFELTDDARGFKPDRAPVSAKPATPKQEHKAPAPSPAVTQAKPTELPRPLMSAEALAKLRAGAQPRQQATVIPTLDSTQTIRTLTKREQEDENAPKWYVVQLAMSDQPANLDTMPRLDIFEAYRLYSVATLDGAVIRHALRLGFFREAVSADAVLGYLKTFFADPRIERVSDAEQKRFIDPPPPKPVSPAIEQARQARVITLEEKRPKFPITQEAAEPAKPATTAKAAPKAAGPATKRAAQPVRKSAPKNGKTVANKLGHLSDEERTAIKEARMLGLSDTAIRRVESNPSILSRLVGKLTK